MYSRPQDLYVGVNLLHISLLPKLLNRLHAFPLQKKNTFMSSCKYLSFYLFMYNGISLKKKKIL